MNEEVTGETIWRGRLTYGVMHRIVENEYGQFLQADANDEVHEVTEPVNTKPTGMLF